MASYGTITTNTDTDTVFIHGPFIFRASGTWGGGTFVVSYRSKSGSWIPIVTSTALTSDATGQLVYDWPEGAGAEVKGTLSGSAGASLSWEFRADDL